jgi:hypothetical protein
VPGGTQEIGLGVAMILVLIFRQRGITNNKEITWPLWRAAKKPGVVQQDYRAQNSTAPPKTTGGATYR